MSEKNPQDKGDDRIVVPIEERGQRRGTHRFLEEELRQRPELSVFSGARGYRLVGTRYFLRRVGARDFPVCDMSVRIDLS